MRCPRPKCGGLVIREGARFRCVACGWARPAPNPAALISWRGCPEPVSYWRLGLLLILLALVLAGVGVGYWAAGGIGVAVMVLVGGGVLEVFGPDLDRS